MIKIGSRRRTVTAKCVHQAILVYSSTGLERAIPLMVRFPRDAIPSGHPAKPPGVHQAAIPSGHPANLQACSMDAPPAETRACRPDNTTGSAARHQQEAVHAQISPTTGVILRCLFCTARITVEYQLHHAQRLEDQLWKLQLAASQQHQATGCCLPGHFWCQFSSPMALRRDCNQHSLHCLCCGYLSMRATPYVHVCDVTSVQQKRWHLQPNSWP